jgi:hypothetical protein
MSERKKPRRVFSAYGALDKKVRNWQYLAPVSRSCGESARGEELVYRINETTLEVGQGASSFRGYVGVAALPMSVCATSALIFLVWATWQYGIERAFAEIDWPIALLVAVLVGGVFVLPVIAFGFVLWINDYFGYVDAPVRFDRTRGKVYIWTSRKAGPLELDWDSIKPVAQSASAPPYQFNSFQSVLLVDEDANGDVRFEGRLPRIAQVGGAVLDKAHTLAAYEFVRVFMERGPQALPPVKEHLAWRHGVRSFVDIMGLIKGMIRDWPTKPKADRSIGMLVFGVTAMTFAAPMFWPLQLSQGIALRTTRIPHWPEKYERMAAEGGPLVPPQGSVSNDLPMLPHEKWVATLWIGSALLVYGLIAWKVLG